MSVGCLSANEQASKTVISIDFKSNALIVAQQKLIFRE
jgi:hypothetical protein